MISCRLGCVPTILRIVSHTCEKYRCISASPDVHETAVSVSVRSGSPGIAMRHGTAKLTSIAASRTGALGALSCDVNSRQGKPALVLPK
jgi:hypothetical protein